MIRSAIYTALLANLMGETDDATLESASASIEYDIYKSSKNCATYQHKISQKVRASLINWVTLCMGLGGVFIVYCFNCVV